MNSFDVQQLKENLDRLIVDSSYTKIDLDYICPNDLEKILQEIDENISFEDSIETNGWDVDFWISFEYKEKGFCFSGSWYYGDYKIMKG